MFSLWSVFFHQAQIRSNKCPFIISYITWIWFSRHSPSLPPQKCITASRRVEFIKCMRSAGLPVEVLIEYVGLVQRGDKTIEARKEILKEQRELLLARMQEMQKTLDILDHKIEVYENAVLKKEKGIVQTEEPEII